MDEEKIKTLEILEKTRQRKNNIIIKEWEILKRKSLETVMEKMIKNEFKIDEMEKAFWTRRETNSKAKKYGPEKRNNDKEEKFKR